MFRSRKTCQSTVLRWLRKLPLFLALVLVLPSPAFAQLDEAQDETPSNEDDETFSRPPTPPTEEVRPIAPTLPPTELELARGMRIAEVRVAGNRRISTDDVLAYLRERPGQIFRPENLTRDVRELWDSGFFDDIEVDLERRADGVHLRFLVRERPSIRNI